jgi:hypothetical protein
MLIHKIVNVICLEQVLLIKLRAPTRLNQGVLTCGLVIGPTLEVVIGNCSTFSATSILSRHQTFLALNNDLARIKNLILYSMVSVPAT